ncbi:CPBP family intramembrane glutamic endopeptidase [Thalassobellus sediminis]|uniref:CPBP family intramembrane glutamic endopeptidase n=1 Tax=Thalassobellus sediminis TaxID=3367753 RepID=UPI0037BAF94E
MKIYKITSEIKETWKTIILFLLILFTLSSLAYYAILKLNPTSIYIGYLMLCPAIASFITLKIRNRTISSLPWNLKKFKYLKLAYFTPIAYTSISYILIWIFGFGDLINTNRILKWSKELNIDSTNQTIVIIVMIFLLLSVGVIKNLGSTLGEEIGWRGFFIFELRKVMPFKALSILSGIIWALWHYPLINLIYGKGELLLFHIVAFTIMIIGISVILAYYTFKSNSFWPAAVYHSIHNIYIQKVCTPMTIYNDNTTYWIDEYGIMIPLITTFFAIYFWQKASNENL